jgi:hypothetical protein
MKVKAKLLNSVKNFSKGTSLDLIYTWELPLPYIIYIRHRIIGEVFRLVDQCYYTWYSSCVTWFTAWRKWWHMACVHTYSTELLLVDYLNVNSQHFENNKLYLYERTHWQIPSLSSVYTYYYCTQLINQSLYSVMYKYRFIVLILKCICILMYLILTNIVFHIELLKLYRVFFRI